jgi:hypothetical protein
MISELPKNWRKSLVATLGLYWQMLESKFHKKSEEGEESIEVQ